MNYSLETERLILRQYEISDAETVALLAGDIEVSRYTLNIPHPYLQEHALRWIESRKQVSVKGDGYTFAIVRREDNQLLGTISINLDKKHNKAELGYWLGKEYWNKGYTTEAAKKVIQFGFEVLNLNRIWAAAFKSNPASEKVMEKIGMKYEGMFRDHVLKGSEYHDVVFYGILRGDFYSL